MNEDKRILTEDEFTKWLRLLAVGFGLDAKKARPALAAHDTALREALAETRECLAFALPFVWTNEANEEWRQMLERSRAALTGEEK